ncbi:Shr3 amino acid permease chaperone [Amylostereum chailletii]|nr:Shr3 amino acid permease chaperone [Amylostereum chailletii]
MGFRQGAVLATSFFFIGILFICFNVDQRILFQTKTEDAIADGFHFYTTFYSAPPAIKAVMHGTMGILVISLIGKLHKWDESAMMFDGGSLVASIFAIAVYCTVSIPSLRTIVNPLPDIDTREDQVDALSVLCAGNVIILFMLGFVLVFQAGQIWAKKIETNELARIEAEEQKQKDGPKEDKPKEDTKDGKPTDGKKGAKAKGSKAKAAETKKDQ